MNHVILLNDDDVIQPGDFARPLDLVYIGQSDYLRTTNEYGGAPMNHTRWVSVERLGWGSHIVGELTVAEFNEHCDAMEKPHQPSTRYEFCRGPLPTYKQLGETEAEREQRTNRCRATFGKHKGLTMKELKDKDLDYYRWAESEGLVSSWIKQGGES